MPAVIQVKRGTASQWTSANTVLAAGEIGFETDTKKMKVGDGSTAWTSLGYTVTDGDISSVVAGTGLSGGGTSGAVTLTNSMATTMTTKGDILVATGNGTFDRLPVGANNTSIVANSSTSTGLEWQAASSGGMTQLATGTLSGSSVAITSISGSYKDLQLVIRNYKPSTDIDMSMRFNNDSTSNRHRRILIVGDGTGGIYNAQFNTTSVVITAYNDDTVAYGLIIIDVFDYANTSTWKMFGVESMETNGATTTNFNYECVRGFYNQTGAITEINLFPNSGTFTSGDYILYGVK